MEPVILCVWQGLVYVEVAATLTYLDWDQHQGISFKYT